MFLIKEKRKHGTNLCIVQSYRDPVTKVSKTKRIMNIGYLEDLQKEYDDPIAHFQEVAKKMTEEQKTKTKPTQIALDSSKQLEPGDNLVKNYGYAALSALYHELKLDVFFRGRQRDLNIEYSLNSIMKLLVYGRILYSGSVNRTFEKKEKFFDKMEFTLDNVYRSFSYLHRYKAQLQAWTHEQIRENYGQDTSKMYYYVTNHYFEVNETDRQRKESASTKHRLDPIVQMGLFVDRNGLPVSYELYPRNPGNMLMFASALRKAHKDYDVGKVIVVADNGNNSADSLYSLISSGNGYVVCQSIRDSKQDIKDYVLDQDGYTALDEDCKIKSRICTREVRITTASGRKKTVSFKERQIIFHNQTYERWARAERLDMLMKAKDLIASPGKYNRSPVYGAGGYGKGMDKASTREYLQSKPLLHLDEERLMEEEKYDGYYMILTSEMDLSIETILETYNDLWELESTFEFTDGTYQRRPEYVARMDYMQAHFLTCFTSLLLTRILEMKTDYKYPLPQMIRCLKKCNYTHIEGNYYVQGYYDEVLDHIGKNVGVDFSKRYGTLCKIKESIGATKKVKHAHEGAESPCGCTKDSPDKKDDGCTANPCAEDC